MLFTAPVQSVPPTEAFAPNETYEIAENTPPQEAPEPVALAPAPTLA